MSKAQLENTYKELSVVRNSKILFLLETTNKKGRIKKMAVHIANNHPHYLATNNPQNIIWQFRIKVHVQE